MAMPQVTPSLASRPSPWRNEKSEYGETSRPSLSSEAPRPSLATAMPQMTPSSSAPRLRSFTSGRAFTSPNPELQAADAAANAEQHEVNAGVRATFGAVHGTLRSQGSAIRGLEELIKKMLPELDRISASDKEKAEAAEVERIAADVAKLDEEAREARSLRVEAVNGLEGKFDAKLGQRALEALARQQHQAEQEAAAREAVGNEVVRLAASCASFSQLVEAVNSEARKADPRLTALERRTEAAEATIATSHDEMVRRLAGKAESKVVEGLAQDVTEAAEAVQRRWAKAEGLTRKCHAEAMKAVGERMERKEAQQALDALAEQVACSCVHAHARVHVYTGAYAHARMPCGAGGAPGIRERAGRCADGGGDVGARRAG